MPDNDTNAINDSSNPIDDVFSPDEPTSPVEPSPDPQPAEGGASNPQPAESSEPPSNAQSSQSAQQTPQSSNLTADDIAKATTKALDQYSKANARNAEANRPMTEAEFNKLFNRIPVQAKVLEAILNPETPMVNKVQALQMILDQNANHAVARANYLVQAAVQKAVAQYQQQMAPIVRNYSAQEAKKSIDDFAAAYPGFDTKAHKDILGAAVMAVQKEFQAMPVEAQRALTKDQVYAKVADKASAILKQVNPNFDPKVKVGGETSVPNGTSSVPKATQRSFPTTTKVNTNSSNKKVDPIDSLFEESDY